MNFIKNIFFILFFLLLPVVGFGQNNASATAIVSVRIIKSLDIQKTSDLNFGNISTNSGEVVVNSKDIRAGGFSIKGKPGAGVAISLPNNIMLKGQHGTHLQMTSNDHSYNIKNDQGSSVVSNNSSNVDATLNDRDGRLYIWFGGKINSNGTKTGVYKGTYTATVTYLD